MNSNGIFSLAKVAVSSGPDSMVSGRSVVDRFLNVG